MEANNVLFKEECYDIIGACMAVHNELGHGFLEAVYHEALEIELEELGIPFESQVPLEIAYKNRILSKQYFPDLVCFNKIIVELKASEEIKSEYISQVLNYLKATGFRLGILVNFGQESLSWKRVVK